MTKASNSMIQVAPNLLRTNLHSWTAIRAKPLTQEDAHTSFRLKANPRSEHCPQWNKNLFFLQNQIDNVF